MPHPLSSRINYSFKQSLLLGFSELQAFQSLAALRTELQLFEGMFFDVTERALNVEKIDIKRSQLAACVVIV